MHNFRKEFHYIQKVLFQHCDPAGIVFYPRYFEFLNACVECWFEEQLNCSFKSLHCQLKRGVPTVTVNAEFLLPSYLGDTLIFTLTVSRLGRSSVDLIVNVLCAEQARVNFSNRIVFIESATGRSVPWPDTLRGSLENYLQEST